MNNGFTVRGEAELCLWHLLWRFDNCTLMLCISISSEEGECTSCLTDKTVVRTNISAMLKVKGVERRRHKHTFCGFIIVNWLSSKGLFFNYLFGTQKTSLHQKCTVQQRVANYSSDGVLGRHHAHDTMKY